MLKITQPLVVAAILALPLSVHATTQDFSWTLNTASCANTTGNCSAGAASGSYEFKKTTGTVANNVTVSAFSTTNDLKTGTNGLITTGTEVAGDTTQDAFETAQVQMWDGFGLGVTSNEENPGDIPHHAFDNDSGSGNAATNPDEKADGGDVDAALFSFAGAINLTSITIGWTNDGGCFKSTPSSACVSYADENTSTLNDVDISILAYTGKRNGVFDPSLPTTLTPDDIATSTNKNKTFTSLLSSGWEFVGHYANLNGMYQTGADLNSLTTNGIVSKYWLISAYTGFADGITNGGNNSNTNLDFGNDYFKITGLGGKSADTTTTTVPEPASFVLVGLGLMGWRMARRNAYVTASNFA